MIDRKNDHNDFLFFPLVSYFFSFLIGWGFLSPPPLMSYPPVRPTLTPCPNPDAYARPPSGWALPCPTSLPHPIPAMLLPRSVRRWRHRPSLLWPRGKSAHGHARAHQSQRKLSEASIFSSLGGSWSVSEAVFKTPIW